MSEVLCASFYAAGMLVFAIYHVCGYRRRVHMKALHIDMVAPLYCPTNLATNNECEICPICLESFESRGDLRRTVCGHVYCAECIQKWLIRMPVCPLCNRSL